MTICGIQITLQELFYVHIISPLYVILYMKCLLYVLCKVLLVLSSFCHFIGLKIEARRSFWGESLLFVCFFVFPQSHSKWQDQKMNPVLFGSKALAYSFFISQSYRGCIMLLDYHPK